MPLQSDTEAALFFPGTLNNQMERILEVPLRASSLMREQELAATLMQIHLEGHNCPESPVSGDWGPAKLLGSHPPSQGLQVLDSAGAAGSGLFRYMTHNPKSREAALRMRKDM